MPTLCEGLQEIEGMFESKSSLSLRESLEKSLIKKYGQNGVLKDAIDGVQSVEDTLIALGGVNMGVKRFLPRRRYETYAASSNERIRQLGELIPEPRHLRGRGILFPDNFLTASALFVAVARAGEYFLPNFLMPDLPQRDFSMIPTLGELIAAPIFGLCMNYIAGRFDRLPLKEARYIDQKVG